MFFEPRDGVFCHGPAFAEPAVGAVFNDAPVVASAWCADAATASVAAITGQAGMVRECFREGFTEDDDVVAVARPSVSDSDNPPVAGPADDLYVDAAPIVLAFCGALPVVDGDQGAVDDPQLPPVSRWWSEELGEPSHNPVGSRVGDAEEGAELLPGEFGPIGQNNEERPGGNGKDQGRPRPVAGASSHNCPNDILHVRPGRSCLVPHQATFARCSSSHAGVTEVSRLVISSALSTRAKPLRRTASSGSCRDSSSVAVTSEPKTTL